MKPILLILFHYLCAAGMSQGLPPQTAIPTNSTRLDVRWAAPTNTWPSALWTYRTEPTSFPQSVVSNLMAFTGYTRSDETAYGTNGMIFENPKRSGNLWISFTEGSIDYWTTARIYDPTNLVQDVPEEKQLFEMTTNIIHKLGIKSSELLTETNSNKPHIRYIQTVTSFFTEHGAITNITSREAHFHRLLDGIEFVGFDRGGNGVVEYGEHGMILKIRLSWRNFKRDKAYPAVTPDKLMGWIREGKVLPQNIPNIEAPPISDWRGVKTVTIKQARIVCVGAGSPGEPGFSRLRPFVALDAIVDTGTTNFVVGIDCPAFEESPHPGSKD